jgi:hypothetical protein
LQPDHKMPILKDEFCSYRRGRGQGPEDADCADIARLLLSLQA